MNKELLEASAIISRLAALGDGLSAGDKRFIESWQSYLANAVEPRIGRWRLFNLRRVAESYDIRVPELAQIGAVEMPSGYGLD